ncbi:MAG: hypothetical protein U0264_03725 [Candidatus Kapaibacterium sp.]
MIKPLLLLLACCSILTKASAQNLENFTALTGAKAAREKVAQMGYSDAKLLQINTYTHNLPIYNYNTIYNEYSEGKALQWIYVFSHSQDNMIITLSVTNEKGSFTITIKDSMSVKSYNAKEDKIEYLHLEDFNDLPTTMIDSDFPFILDSGPFPFQLYNDSHSLGTFTLNSYKNSEYGWYGLANTMAIDSLSTFVWVVTLNSGGRGLDGSWSGSNSLTAGFSGINGIQLFHHRTTDVQEPISTETSYFLISPNPTTGSISINGTTTSPQIPIHVRIIDALGRQQYQDYTQASPDGTFTFIWDGLAGGESLPTGAYSAVMTVGSVVKSVPFVVVR